MKKLIVITAVLVLMLTLSVPASAVTTMKWDWNKARSSIGKVASGMVQEQQTEPAEAEYTVEESGHRWLEWYRNRMERILYGVREK